MDVVFKILLVAKPKCNLYILLEGLEVAKVIIVLWCSVAFVEKLFVLQNALSLILENVVESIGI